MSVSTFPPQTTPFTPPHSADCTMSVLCEHLTYSNYADGNQSLSGMSCQAVNRLGRREVGTQTACFPEGYLTIFKSTSETHSGTKSTKILPTESPGSLTLAYPGSACISGWTTACTTTITARGSKDPQTWCCPPGSWTCASQQPHIAAFSLHSSQEEAAVTGRYCASVMTEATEIWMSWDPPMTLSDDGMYHTWTASVTAEPTQSAATVFHPVFPLRDVRGTNVPPTTSRDGFKRDAFIPDDTSGGLAPAQVAGIVIGCVLSALIFIGWGLMCWLNSPPRSSGLGQGHELQNFRPSRHQAHVPHHRHDAEIPHRHHHPEAPHHTSHTHWASHDPGYSSHMGHSGGGGGMMSSGDGGGGGMSSGGGISSSGGMSGGGGGTTGM
ncbi:hypothetical protein F5Y04DRAFT_291040 [Hypomontagnella monticulosa]|nr:hypothetical protein F5Y04DRAFT_291040 [Hypomontagnella monticulosa]